MEIGGQNIDPLNWGGVTKRWAGQSGYNPEQPEYDSTRPDQERALAGFDRVKQDEYNQWLRNAALGKGGPSLAQQQLSQGRDQAISAAASQAAAARGGNAALANRTATQAGANAHMQAARDASALRAQEQMGYANQWGQGLQAQRAQDLTQRGQTIDEQKAQLAAQGQYQSTKGQIAAGEAERGQGIFGSVLGGTTNDLPVISDQASKMNIDSPGDAKYGVQVHNVGQPAIRTGGAVVDDPVTAVKSPGYSDQFAAIGSSNPQIGTQSQQQTEEGEKNRASSWANVGQQAMNAKSDHGAGLITSLIGMLSDEKAKTGIVDKARAAMSEHVSRGPVGLLTDYGRQATGDTAKRAAERVVGWLQPEKMQTGAVEGARGGVDYATGAAYMARAPQSRRVDIANATRKPDGSVDMGRAQNDYAAKMAAWEQAGRDADEDRRRVGRARKGRNAAEEAGAKLEREREWYRTAMAPDPSGGGHVVYSGADTKRENVALRAALRAGTPAGGDLRGGTERLERDFAQLPDKEWQYRPEFADRANERMGLPPTARFGDVRKSSPMAEDFARVASTRGVVAEDPQTGMKMLDGGQLAATTAAATGAVARHALSLEERMQRLEGRNNPNPGRDRGAGVTDAEWEEVRRGLRGR